VSSGRLVLALVDVDLAELARDVTSRFVDVAARARCELTVDAPAPVHGRWDRERLDQVLSNIIGNAVKYGHGKPVDVSCRAHEGDAEIVVRDRGIGIAPEDQSRIFERFERAVGDQHYPGLGLGLWIVREIVAQHGGSVNVKSALGAGTEIAVTLPRAR
jgi:signal transduction histidine kinase